MKKKADDGTERFKRAALRVALQRVDRGVALERVDRGVVLQRVDRESATHVRRPTDLNNDDGTLRFREHAHVNAVRRHARQPTTEASQPTAEASQPTAVPIAPPTKCNADAPRLCTDRFQPKTMHDVVGHTTAKTQLVAWVKQSPSVCLMSGPVGVGKTCLARAVLNDAGFHGVSLCSESGDFTVLLQDLVYTPPSQPMCVVIDEVENLVASDRTSLVTVLRKCRKPATHIIVICEDAGDRDVKSVAKYVDVHVRLMSPQTSDLRRLADRLCAVLDVRIDAPHLRDIIEGVHGDMRQLVVVINEIKMSSRHPATCDRRFKNPMQASAMVLRSTNIEEGFQAACTDRDLVRLITVKHLPHVVYSLADLAERFENISAAEVMQSTHTAMDSALLLHVYGTSRTTTAGPVPRLEFPGIELGLRQRTNSNRDTFNRLCHQVRGVCDTRRLPEFNDAIVRRLQHQIDVDQVEKPDLDAVVRGKLGSFI